METASRTDNEHPVYRILAWSLTLVFAPAPFYIALAFWLVF